MKLLVRQKKPADPIKEAIIRHLRKSDLPALEWGGEYTHFRELYKNSFKNAEMGRSVLWVVEIRRIGVVGQLFVQLQSGRKELADGKERAYIYGFRIQPEYREKGIGTRMMKVAEQDIYSRGFSKITLNVSRDNPDARRLYERLGYRIVADEPGKWSFIDHEGRVRHIDEPSWRMEKNTHTG